MEKAEEIGRKLGYIFRDAALLETCFTHSSYANEHGGESNERLEFLGDAVLGFLVADELYRTRGVREGEMTALRSRLVSAKPLAEAIRADGLEQYLRVSGSGAGEKAVSSLFEALTAGIYLDGGLEAARAFVRAKLSPEKAAGANYKGELQEYLQARLHETARYVLVSQEGEAHAPRFTVRAEGAGEQALGTGGSVRAAEKDAARSLLELLKERGEERH